mgnify:CR=1 FL=1
MICKFNDGYGAVLCSRCGKIVYLGSQIPSAIQKLIMNSKDTSELPDIFCPECSDELDHIL